MNELVFSVLLLCACALVVVGVGFYASGAAFIVAGLLLAGWSWLVLSDEEVTE